MSVEIQRSPVDSFTTHKFCKLLVKNVEAKLEEAKSLKDTRKNNLKGASYKKILMTYADGTDKLLLTIGLLFAIASGFAQPSFTFLFGDIANGIGGGDSSKV